MTDKMKTQEELLKNLHKELHAQGIVSIRIAPKDKRPIGYSWGKQKLLTPEQIDAQPYIQDEGIGILTDKILALDLDIADKETEDKIISLFPTAPRKKGKLGSTLLFAKHPDYSFSQTQKLLTKHGNKTDQIQILTGPGHQTVLPPSIHPDTLEPYVWEVPLSFPLPQFLTRKEFAEALKSLNLPNETVLNQKVKLNVNTFHPEKAKDCPISQNDQVLLKEWIKLLREDQWNSIDNGDYYRKNIWAVHYIFRGHESGIPFALLFTKDPEIFCSGKGRERLTREQYCISRYRSAKLDREYLADYNHLVSTSNRLNIPIPNLECFKKFELERFLTLCQEAPPIEKTQAYQKIAFKNINQKLYDKFFSVHGCERIATHQTLSTILFSFPRVTLNGECSTNILAILGADSGIGKDSIDAFKKLPNFDSGVPTTESRLHTKIRELAIQRKTSTLWLYSEGELIRPKKDTYNQNLATQLGDYFTQGGKNVSTIKEVATTYEVIVKKFRSQAEKELTCPLAIEAKVLDQLEAYKHQLQSLAIPKVNCYVATQPKVLGQFTLTDEWALCFARRSYVCFSDKKITGPKKETIGGHKSYISIEEELKELTQIQPFENVAELFSKQEDFDLILPENTIETFNNLTQQIFDEFYNDSFPQSIQTIALSCPPLLKKLAFAIQTGNEGHLLAITSYYLQEGYKELRNHILDAIKLSEIGIFETNKQTNQRSLANKGDQPISKQDLNDKVFQKMDAIFKPMAQSTYITFGKLCNYFQKWNPRPANSDIEIYLKSFGNLVELIPNPEAKKSPLIIRK